MNEQAHIADRERALQGDIEEAFAHLFTGTATEQEKILACWAAGVKYEVIRKQGANREQSV